MRRVKFHPAAALDAEEAAVWYEGERAGLGNDFARELAAAIALLGQKPDAGVRYPHVRIRRNVKRILLKRFPFDLIYFEGTDAVVIVAVAHHSRRPGYWRARLRT